MAAVRPEEIRIGWTELVDLPEWGVKRLRAKVDTGARTSALHVDNIRELPHDQVSFDVVLHRAKLDRRVPVKTRIVRRGHVRSSSGHQTNRIFVETAIRLGPVTRTIEVSLVDRGEMLHRMLLGRKALGGPFVIDVDRRMLLSPRKKRTKKGRKKTPAADAGKRRHAPDVGRKSRA
jgi:hypothetical protein